MNLIYRKHAIIRMFERGITDEDIRSVLLLGEVIIEYSNDKPYPSRLILGWLNNNPVHVLTAENDDGDSVIITAYQPDPMLWEDDFKRKKS